MITKFVDKTILDNPENYHSVKRMRNLGFRFDLKIIALFLTIPFLMAALLSTIFSVQTILASYAGYILISSFFITLALICNYFYFKTYNNYYDVFIFGLIEEDTKAVLKNILDDYPVIRIITTASIISLIPTFLICNYKTPYLELPLWLNILIFISMIVAMFFAIRGTINSKPLGRIHSQVSQLAILNKMVPNGILAIRWAFQDRKRNVNFKPVDKLVGKQLINESGLKTLYAKTAKNEWLEHTKPNVVLTIMESFGLNGLITDNKDENDLLGSLRSYMETEFVFKRFLSSSNGTMSTLASIYFHSPMQEITQSIAQNVRLKTTPFLIYKNQGYKTVFISAGNMMWRNLANYLPIQGVDELYDQNTLIDRYPEAKNTLSYWGVADEFAFKLANELLENANEPMFINILTITNHPPYKAPNAYIPNKVNPKVFKDKFGENDTERRNILESFQYACNALGNFITDVKQGNKKDNTIIAATGDHHIRGMKHKFPEEFFMANAVPFILSVPSKLQTQFEIDYLPAKLGSHKDIMPTLYHLSLSDIEYLHCGGENLLAPVTDNYFAFHPYIWADNSGVIDLTSPDFTKYKWDDQDKFFIKNNSLDHNEHNKINAYTQLLDWQINYLIKGYQDEKKD
ncbi:sulfatase-like hydrolase/transferase [Mannheimia sp. AT1]|uniref:Sulfatase-like hydrolase/transferase n=1 Tax=Mannheimia cairinae TaxID=3025936 RepID=A0ABT5MTP4_9PAST|nr:alkaline phosphatase family protein [Mannheimia cairinae]MDD0824272.1 sulfatase-like hydrolase/transferase [Mannheimia cairinae]MDD0826605.1 sulfatase-like hydrolase/transferase [Mannheimia cairinae]